MSTREHQLMVRDALLASDVDDDTWAALGGDPQRWQVYRRMVRARMRQTLEHALPLFSELLGADAWAALVDEFWGSRAPRSPYLRDLPGELLDFVARNPGRRGSREAWPLCALDIARYEWAELAVAYQPDERRERPCTQLSMDAVAVLHPAHRVLALTYPVHRADTVSGLTALTSDPMVVCVYRDAQSHESQTLELTPLQATLFRGMGARAGTLTEIVRNAALAHGVQVDVALVAAVSELLATLAECGLLLGSLGDSEE